MKKRKPNGFTLLELIVTIGILAILSTFLMMALNPFEQFQKASDARRKSDLSQIQKALEAYYQDVGRYPDSSGGVTYYIQTADAVDPVKEWGTAWSPYMSVLPEDKGGRKYIYVASSDGQAYYLYASLERGTRDLNICKSDGAKCDNAPVNTDCGAVGHTCNYGISSPNVSP